jgi:transposase-like protein
VAKARRKHTASFKAKVALEATRGAKTMAELSKHYGIHASQIQKWKSHLLANLAEIFGPGHKEKGADDEELISHLYQQIGKLQVELEWLKKKSDGLY